MFIEELEKTYLERKRANPVYSIRAFARDLDINSATLSALLNRKRPLTLKTAKGLLQKLNWKPGLKKKLLEDMADSNPGDVIFPADTIPDSHGEILAHWETFGILSLLDIPPRKFTTEEIRASLNISAQELVGYLELLQKHNYIMLKNEKWSLVKLENRKSVTDIPKDYLVRGNLSKIQRSLLSLKNDSVEDRDFTNMTMAIDPSKLPEAKKIIAKFRREMCEFLESGKQQSVYQLTIQLVPLTKLKASK